MNGWKVTAVIFIILFIIESLAVLWVWNLGTDLIEKENTCIVNVCTDADTYYYDQLENICYCYQNNELTKTEYLGGK